MFEQRSALLLTLTFAALLVGCGGNPQKENQILLMPAPDVYEEGKIDPFIDNDPISRGVPPGILYATDRKPAEPGDRKYQYYTHERGFALRLGQADIILGDNPDMTWEEARRLTLLKNRTDDYPLQVGEVQEFGVLAETVRPFDSFEESGEPGQAFIDAVNARLAASERNDVYVYVHGYKVNFENPLLVASELWHFLGYNGAFVAYSWPTRFSIWNYLVSVDNSINSARNLRALVLHIAQNTDVEKIHIIGYSMGTRTVSRMLADFGMYGYFFDKEDIDENLKLGNVYLIGSDVDRNIIGGYLQDGALRIPDSLTIYMSSADSALNMSRKVFGRERTGQLMKEIRMGERSWEFFKSHPELRIIDVTDAEGGTSGSGHGYFRGSPWVSSDLLMSLLYNLTPKDRGLVMREDAPLWTFPPDYVAHLRDTLARVNPSLGIETQAVESEAP